MDRRDRERWAAERVKPWGKPQRNDYDFRSWTKGAPKELLNAGCIYEYARESRKLRCLLVLMKAAQKRRDSEPCSFEGLLDKDAYRTLGGALYWLFFLVDDLADNKSFAELLRARAHRVKEILHYKRFDFSPLKAIRPAIAFPGDPVIPWSWLPSDQRAGRLMIGGPAMKRCERHICNDGSENIGLQIFWADFTNAEIAKEMREFAYAYRPKNDKCKEPQRKGRRPMDVVGSRLKALSVIRISKRERNQWKRLNLVAKFCAYSGCVRESNRGGWADAPIWQDAKVEMSKARADARSFFQSLFPGETMSNF